MNDDISNDNEALSVAPSSNPDAHGQAAMLLVESLIHGLVERKLLSVVDAVEIVDAATQVKLDTGAELGDSSVTLQKSLMLLQAIGASLRSDITNK